MSNFVNGSVYNYVVVVDIIIMDGSGKLFDMGVGYDDIC